MTLRFILAVLAGVFSFTLALRTARADKVAVLPFTSGGNATAADLQAARTATREATVKLSHRLPTAPEMLTAEMATKGGGPTPTSEQYRAAGRASTSDWTVSGRVETHGASYRLELEACQVDTGRVESLFREVERASATDQIAEMLALLLRPEGIGNAEIPWLKATAAKPPAPPSAQTKIEVKRPPAPLPPPEPPPAPAVRHVYAEGHPFALGASVSALTAISRASNAQGSPTSFHVGAAGAYALGIAGLPGLELRADLVGAVAGPSSFFGDAGARYMFALVPTLRIFAGPELAIGAFGTFGGDRTARFLARSALAVAVGLGERVQLELGGEFLFAPGGASSLALGGGALRGFFRF